MEKLNADTCAWLLGERAIPEGIWHSDSPLWTRVYSDPDSRDIDVAARIQLEEVGGRSLAYVGYSGSRGAITLRPLGFNRLEGLLSSLLDIRACCWVSARKVLSCFLLEIYIYTRVHMSLIEITIFFVHSILCVFLWMAEHNSYAFYSPPLHWCPHFFPVVKLKVLRLTGTKRMVVGHTPQRAGINSAADGQIWRVDTGMTAMIGGRPEVSMHTHALLVHAAVEHPLNKHYI